MKMHDFVIKMSFQSGETDAPYVVDGEAFLDMVEDPLFEAFQGGVTPSVSETCAYLYCHVESDSLMNAVVRVARVMKGMGLGPGVLEMPVSEFLSGGAYA